LKISTFKVRNVGQKIGELFIKLSIDFCVKHDLTEIYLTHFSKPSDRLIELIREYGFKNVSVNKDGEDIFVKELIGDSSKVKQLSPIQIIKEFYPSFYDGPEVKKYIIPIKPTFHERLFTDYIGRQTIINEHMGEFIVEGNAIKKAYITNSKITKIREGDIIFFYRSRDKSAITTLGVVESIYLRLTKPEEIMRIVGKRTVYSMNEIRTMTKKPITVLLFYHIWHIPNPISLHNLKEIGVLSGPPQSICEIDEERYLKIIERSGIDGRFIIH